MFSLIFADTCPDIQSEQYRWPQTVAFENISDEDFVSMQMSQKKLSDDWDASDVTTGSFIFNECVGVDVSGIDDADDDDESFKDDDDDDVDDASFWDADDGVDDVSFWDDDDDIDDASFSDDDDASCWDEEDDIDASEYMSASWSCSSSAYFSELR